MSAWLVSKTHVDLLVGAGLILARADRPLRWQENPPKREGPYRAAQLCDENADEIGLMLWSENLRSVSYRYRNEPLDQLASIGDFDQDALLSYRFQPVPGTLDPVVVLKAISCYEYQSCEHPGWADSQAYRFCLSLRAACIDNLPGYSGAPWGFDDRDFFTKPDNVGV